MNTDMQTYHNNVFEQIVLTAARLKTTVAAATKFYYSNVSSQKDFLSRDNNTNAGNRKLP